MVIVVEAEAVVVVVEGSGANQKAEAVVVVVKAEAVVIVVEGGGAKQKAEAVVVLIEVEAVVVVFEGGGGKQKAEAVVVGIEAEAVVIVVKGGGAKKAVAVVVLFEAEAVVIVIKGGGPNQEVDKSIRSGTHHPGDDLLGWRREQGHQTHELISNRQQGATDIVHCFTTSRESDSHTESRNQIESGAIYSENLLVTSAQPEDPPQKSWKSCNRCDRCVAAGLNRSLVPDPWPLEVAQVAPCPRLALGRVDCTHHGDDGDGARHLCSSCGWWLRYEYDNLFTGVSLWSRSRPQIGGSRFFLFVLFLS
jgi:hypothetical protein